MQFFKIQPFSAPLDSIFLTLASRLVLVWYKKVTVDIATRGITEHRIEPPYMDSYVRVV